MSGTAHTRGHHGQAVNWNRERHAYAEIPPERLGFILALLLLSRLSLCYSLAKVAERAEHGVGACVAPFMSAYPFMYGYGSVSAFCSSVGVNINVNQTDYRDSTKCTFTSFLNFARRSMSVITGF